MRIRKLLRKIHRWVGLLSALWLIQLAITGLLLQHADDLKLTTTHVSSPAVLKWFGYGSRAQIWQYGDQTFYQIDGVVGFGGLQVDLSSPVIAAVNGLKVDAQTQWVVATSSALYWFNPQGEIRLQLDDFDGVPTPISGLSIQDNSITVLVENQWYVMQADKEFAVTSQHPESIHTGRSMTAKEQNQYFAAALKDKLSYDKVLHGIHAGIQGSKWLNSLSALALLFLCLSGIYLFFKHPKSKR